MKDTIYKEDAIKALRERWARTTSYDGIGEDIGEECEEVIEAIPSADRPQGMWELVPCTGLSEYFEGVKHGFRYRCSNCKDERRRNKLENFCPHCGARMKGADDE